MVISFYRRGKLAFHVGVLGNIVLSNLPYKCLKLSNRTDLNKLQSEAVSVGENLQLLLNIGNSILKERNLNQYHYPSWMIEDKKLIGGGFDELLEHQKYVQIFAGMYFSKNQNKMQFYLLSVEIIGMRMFSFNKFESDFESITKTEFECNLNDQIRLEYIEVYDNSNIYFTTSVECQNYTIYLMFSDSYVLLLAIVD